MDLPSGPVFGIKFWADFTSSALAAVAGAGVGAWLGALFAFRTERARAAEERELARRAAAAELAGRRASAANLAIFALSQIWNDLATYEKQFLVPARKSPAPWFWLQPSSISEQNFYRFDVPSLAFLLQVKRPGASETLMKLALEQSRFAAFLETVQIRARFFEQYIPPIVERLQATHGLNFQPKEAELRGAVGEINYQTLRNYLSDIETLVRLGLQSSHALAVELRKQLLEELPGQTLIGFEAADGLTEGSEVMRARNAAARNEPPRPGSAG